MDFTRIVADELFGASFFGSCKLSTSPGEFCSCLHLQNLHCLCSFLLFSFSLSLLVIKIYYTPLELSPERFPSPLCRSPVAVLFPSCSVEVSFLSRLFSSFVLFYSFWFYSFLFFFFYISPYIFNKILGVKRRKERRVLFSIKNSIKNKYLTIFYREYGIYYKIYIY